LIKLPFLILSILLIINGCLPVVPSTPVVNELRLPILIPCLPRHITQGQTIIFSGHGTDVGGTIVAYNWRSDRDGNISQSASFSTSSLSAGNHYMYFKVQDNYGDWSREVIAIVNVLSPVFAKPSVNFFQGNTSNHCRR